VQEKQVILISTFSGNIASENYSDTSGKGSPGLKQLNVIALLYSRKNVEYYSYYLLRKPHLYACSRCLILQLRSSDTPNIILAYRLNTKLDNLSLQYLYDILSSWDEIAFEYSNPN
jgi:hypothetical protein